MDQAAQRFIEDPSLIVGMTIAIIFLVGSVVYLGRYILHKMQSVIERNTTAFNKTIEAIDAQSEWTKVVSKKLDEMDIHAKIEEGIKRRTNKRSNP